MLTFKVVLRKLSSQTSQVKAEKEAENVQNLPRDRKKLIPPIEYRHIYPEFVPDPDVSKRNSLRERLERQDMLQRRKQIDIPEFYVGKVRFNNFI